MKKRIKITEGLKKRNLNKKIPKQTMQILNRAWKDLPPDFSINERLMFVELAERIIKLSSIKQDN
ncbi:MAG: hypothetical protein A3E68_00205 [Candidatus Levybacteria bacterium RIFCSPHIGHO2_12_FULL_39_39]|nr:MAG: hypothetical protein UT85_C0021G0004 [Candidatus Levybacteria bacterium GW2011_GWA2_40_16]OGH25549.1 MAG: hypothetical protein A3E68_00205 [Candidatus Levybacteria bacterium RIFCSPHIGHO2_12_FULL_39_39]OGH36116.1 MAG: hypothetical protein A3B43_02635 [Candidatus Levybacteria bacterium RIFCSPLOWO2_01_FULL_38_120]OGH48404.1 MAG: hypothetical protein A3G66_01520 [Candidatus Levybacteria bacterium RIFCSPLOWO2_12_FULL_39_17]